MSAMSKRYTFTYKATRTDLYSKRYCSKDNVPTEDTTIKNEETNIENNEIICQVCKRGFKSKSGLAVHMKSHENK